MKRREFIESGAVALVVATVIPTVLINKSWRDMTPEELARHTLGKRRASITPNYEEIHECPTCKASYLCPDRYLQPSCGPTDWEAKFGRTSRVMSCLPCAAQLDDDRRRLWYEAHKV